MGTSCSKRWVPNSKLSYCSGEEIRAKCWRYSAALTLHGFQGTVVSLPELAYSESARASKVTMGSSSEYVCGQTMIS